MRVRVFRRLASFGWACIATAARDCCCGDDSLCKSPADWGNKKDFTGILFDPNRIDTKLGRGEAGSMSRTAGSTAEAARHCLATATSMVRSTCQEGEMWDERFVLDIG